MRKDSDSKRRFLKKRKKEGMKNDTGNLERIIED